MVSLLQPCPAFSLFRFAHIIINTHICIPSIIINFSLVSRYQSLSPSLFTPCIQGYTRVRAVFTRPGRGTRADTGVRNYAHELKDLGLLTHLIILSWDYNNLNLGHLFLYLVMTESEALVAKNLSKTIESKSRNISRAGFGLLQVRGMLGAWVLQGHNYSFTKLDCLVYCIMKGTMIGYVSTNILRTLITLLYLVECIKFWI